MNYILTVTQLQYLQCSDNIQKLLECLKFSYVIKQASNILFCLQSTIRSGLSNFIYTKQNQFLRFCNKEALCYQLLNQWQRSSLLIREIGTKNSSFKYRLMGPQFAETERGKKSWGHCGCLDILLLQFLLYETISVQIHPQFRTKYQFQCFSFTSLYQKHVLRQ